MTTLRVLVLTEDSSKQAIPALQQLLRAAFKLLVPGHDSRLLKVEPLPSNESAIRACHANEWKNRRSPHLPRLLGHIASHLAQDATLVAFHVDSDTTWSRRSESENRTKFLTIIREGVKKVLCGAAQNPIAPRRPKYLSEAEADRALGRLVVMHPCYSVEGWLYQAVDEVLTRCRARHSSDEHRRVIESWRSDRTLLDEVLRPKELLDCLGAFHNEALAANFPSQEVLAAKRSWAEFLEALERTQLPQRLGGDGSSP